MSTGRASIDNDSALLFWAQVVGNVGFFVAVLCLARGLGPGGRGTVAFVIITALVVARVARIGVPEATTVFAAQRPEARPNLLSNTVIFTCIAAGSMGAGVAWLLLFTGAAPAGIGRIEIAILALGTLVIALAEAASAFLTGCGRIASRAAITAATPWVYALLVALVWALAGLTVTDAVVVWTTAQAIGAAVTLVAATRGIGFGRPDGRLLFGTLRFGSRVWLGSLSSFLNFRIDQVIMGFISTDVTLGVYAVAVNTAEVLLYLPDAVATALLPKLAALPGQRQIEQSLAAFRSTSLITALGVVAAVILGPALLPLLFGQAFEGSVTAFLWLLPGAFGFVATRIFSSALLTSGSPGLFSLASFVSLIVGVVLDLALIPRFGATGAAVAATLAFTAGGFVALISYKLRSPFALALLVPLARDLDVRSLLSIPLGAASLVVPYAKAVTRRRSRRWQERLSEDQDSGGLRILVYHRISDDRDDLAVTPQRFREQMEFLASNGYEVIDVVSAGARLGGGAPLERVIAMTLDDGYVDAAENSVAVLGRLGFRATMFVTTGAADGNVSFAWYRNPPPVLSWDAIRQLDRGSVLGFESHSLTRRDLRRLTAEEAKAEIADSKAVLERQLGRPVAGFCYPAGLFGPRERRLVAEAGYAVAVTREPGVNLPGADRYTLKRLQIDPRDSLLDFSAKVAGAHDSPVRLRSIYRRMRHGAR